MERQDQREYGSRRFVLLSFVFLFCSLAVSFAQDRPHIGYMYPAGVQQGSNIIVILGGQFLENVTNVYITGKGVRSRIVSYNRDIDPFAMGQLYNSKNILEGRLNIVYSYITNGTGTNRTITTNITTNEAYNVRTVTTSNLITNTTGDITTNYVVNMISNVISSNESFQLYRQLARTLQMIAYAEKPPDDRDTMMYMRDIQRKKQPNAQLTDLIRLEISADSDAHVGRREIRLMTVRGFSEPIAFYVGSFQEQVEREPNPVDSPNRVASLPMVMNGQILPGETDCFRFKAQKGQRLVFVVQARALIPYLADAVPGWFQSVISLYDPKGREIAYEDDYLGNPDPALAFTVPEDGEYTIEIRDSIYRGREDFVYRIIAGEMPYASMVYPLGGLGYGTTRVDYLGLNIGNGEAFIEPRLSETGIVSVPPPEGGVPLPVLFYADDMPEEFEKAGNNIAATAQRVRLPVVINGKIETPGDIDTFSFSGRGGERFIAEVFARRLGSPLDSLLRLTDSRGTVLQTNDDNLDRSAGSVTHHADSYISCVLPTNGTYYLSIRDVQGKGGDLYAYRLQMSPPRPDFKLRVSPSTVSIARGASLPLSLFIQRVDGFTNEVTLSLEGAPEGYSLSGGNLRGSTESLTVTLNAPANAETNTYPIKIIGTASVEGKTIRHTALPCEDMMQAFANRHLMISEDFIVMTLPDRARATLAIDTGSNSVSRIMQGKDTALTVKYPLPAGGRSRVTPVDLQLELDNPPKGILVVSTAPISPTNDTVVIIRTDEKLVKPGMTGNLIFNAYQKWKGKDARGNETSGRNFLCTLPAAPFVIAP